jgi:hypothetical protein
MKILGLLKKIGIDLSQLKEVVGLNIKFSSLVNIDHSVQITGSTVIINPKGLSGKQRRGLKKIISGPLLEDAGAIINESYEPTVKEVVQALSEIDGEARRLIQIIPPADVPLLNACLFLRRRFRAGINIENLKVQIMRVYGTRGGNFANLCSAGYLETWFLPLYEELLRASAGDPSAAKAQFQIHYKTIVTDLPWTEFVQARSTGASVEANIVGKMMRNIANGVPFLNIHGLGESNVRKVDRILPEILKQTGAVIAKMEKEPTRIFVRLEILPETKRLS